MAKLVVFNLISLDGFFEADDITLDWFNADAEFNNFSWKQLQTVDTILMGRITYEGMYEYWTSDLAFKTDPEIAELMNTKRKLIFSKTLKSVKWENANLISDKIEQNILDAKADVKGDIILFGSGDLLKSLLNLGLVDELRLMVVSILLGNGKRMFQDLNGITKLNLIDKKQFKSGNLLLTYRTDNVS